MPRKIKSIFISLVSAILILPCFHFAKAADDVPTIYPRSSWSNAKYDKRSKKVWPAEYDDLEVVIVHHTATNYNYKTSKQIKKIYKYHSYTKKWGDIGYNYIIGEDGLIFEGRYGGNGVIAGHSYYNGTNYNKGSIGIAVLGNYENEDLSSAARDSLEKLIGWLSANNNISVKTSTKFHGKSLDNSVIGHRNVASTACPGKNIYKLMGSIRSNSESFAASYSGYAYRIPGSDEKYEISEGKKYSRSTKSPVVEISETQLSAYPSDGIASGDYDYPSGTLVYSGSNKGVIENGIIRPITNESVLSASYDSSDFIEITSEKWNSYTQGAEASFRNGSFVKDPSGDYYIISSSQKRKLVLSNNDLELVNLSTAHEISSTENARYAVSTDITSTDELPTGTIITNNNKKFYYVTGGGTKKKVTKNVFRATFSNSMAAKVSAKLLNRYKTKGKLAFQDGAVVDYRGKYYFIENGKRRQFATKNLAKAMGYRNFVKAKRTEMSGIGKGSKIE